jgi:ABC-type oligopeptide transport system substrate-binding subunit
VAGRLGGTLAMLVAGAALLATACWVSTGSAGEAPRGGTLRIAAANVDFVDPARGYLRDSWLIQDATCARLFAYRDVGGERGWRVVPEVVDRFTVSRDGRTYTYILKDTFRFHTGARVTAQSFADALDRGARLRTPPSPATTYMHDIVGADAVINGKAQSITGVRVLDRYRLQVALTKPLGDLTARLTMPFFCPVPPDTPIATIERPSGSGPYYVAEHVLNQRITLKRNPFYRGDRPRHVDQIVLTTGESLAACLLALEEDRVDLCGQPTAPRDAWRGLAETYGINRPDGRLFVSPSLGTWAYAFNHSRPAFRGPGQIPLKKAINFAIDRPALARTFGYLAGKRTDQMLPPALARAESIYPLGGANPVAARRWYAKARFKPSELVLYTWNFPHFVAQAQIVAFNLKQLGIDLEVKYFSPESLGAQLAISGEPFDLAIFGWSVDYGDATTFFVPLFGPGAIPSGVNLDDPRLNRRIDTVDRLSGEARRDAWADLDIDLMRDNPPWAPFMHINSRALLSPSLGCFTPNPILGVEITALCKKR